MTEAAIFGLELSGGSGYDDEVQRAPETEPEPDAEAPVNLTADKAA